MNGITILSTIHTQMPQIKGSMLFILVVGCIVLSVALVSMLREQCSDGIGIVLLVALIVCLVSATAVRFIEDDRYIYATIKPGTSINEVINNYEIIDIDKDLYKLKIIEKEKQNEIE
jgi:hypothetical protein